MSPAAPRHAAATVPRHAMNGIHDDVQAEPAPQTPLRDPPADEADADLRNDPAFLGFHAGPDQTGARSDLLEGPAPTEMMAGQDARAAAAAHSSGPLVRSPEDMNLVEHLRDHEADASPDSPGGMS